ncbi:MAG: T9SS type A sorting domain-containing protein [Aureispira sp.]|nr:T9SS type A sorting domain-containing protein [Aureispira sp.]
MRDLQAELSVELLNFEATRRNQHQVNLDWTTASETNNKGFWVERMLESENDFSELAWVDGNGTITHTAYYNLVDENAFTGTSYYRLRQVDLDGSIAYSQVRAVRGASEIGGVQIFPNPVDDYINIRLPKLTDVVNIQIFDIKGSLILDTEQKALPNQILKISNLSHLIEGTYLINIQINQDKIYTEKFIKRGN